MQPVIRCLSSFRYLKVHALVGSSYILACSPENSAADLLAERLLPHVDKGDLFRIYASSRPWDCASKAQGEHSNSFHSFLYNSIIWTDNSSIQLP